MAVNIVLLGMMGAGKTSVGERLSELTGRRFIDTDKVIEKRHGSITDIFARFGEAHFRALESALAVELSGEDGLIVSTGGGMILKAENREALKKNGVLIYLRAGEKTLASRVGSDAARPLLSVAQDRSVRLKELLEARAPIYEAAADYIVDTDEKSIEETAGAVLALAAKEGI